MTPQETFVTRLRRHRQRNQVSLEEIAAEWRVKPELLDALEKNDLSQWPSGLYARAWIRGYACSVGLDPTDAVDEFCRLFPQGDRRAQGTIQDLAAIVASPSEYRDEFSCEDRRASPEGAVTPKLPWHAAALASVRAFWGRLLPAKTSPAVRAGRSARPSL